MSSWYLADYVTKQEIAGLTTELVPNKAVISGTTGGLATSATSAVEVGRLAGLRSSAQAQLDAQQLDITSLTTALSGKEGALPAGSSGQFLSNIKTFRQVAIADIPTLQTTLNDLAAGSGNGDLIRLDPSKCVVTDNTGALASSTLDASKLPYLQNVTSDVKASIDSKEPLLASDAPAGSFLAGDKTFKTLQVDDVENLPLLLTGPASRQTATEGAPVPPTSEDPIIVRDSSGVLFWWSSAVSQWIQIGGSSDPLPKYAIEQTDVKFRSVGLNSALDKGGLARVDLPVGGTTTLRSQDGSFMCKDAGNNVLMALDSTGQLTVGSTASVSDERYKRALDPISSQGDALERVRTLTGYTYEMKNGAPGDRRAGVIAQQLRTVLPEAVRPVRTSGDEELLSVDYNAVVALLVEALKTCGDRIDNLEDRLRNVV